MGVAYAATEETTGIHCIHRLSYCGEDAACSLVHRGLGENPVASHGLGHDLPLAPVIKPPHPRFLLYGGVKPTQGPSCSIYVPATKQALAPIMVALHFCTGTGPGYFRNSRYADLADTKGFHSHLPDGPFCQHLFEFQEARSPQIQNLPLLPTRVPPGAMTVRTGSQRSLLKLGGGYGKELRPWSQRHANQDVDVSSPGQNTAPTGGTNRRHSRHGTSDVLFPLAHLADTLGQWSSLLGVSLAQNIPDSPQANYTKIVYGNGTELVGYEARGVVHTLPLFANVELEFFGIV